MNKNHSTEGTGNRKRKSLDHGAVPRPVNMCN
jgi:hypothetical protein